MIPNALRWLGMYSEVAYGKVFEAVLKGLQIKNDTEIPEAILDTIFDPRLVLGEDVLKGILESQDTLTLIHLLVADYFWRRQDEGVTHGFEFPQQEFEATVNVFREHLKAYGTSNDGLDALRSHILRVKLDEAMIVRTKIYLGIMPTLEVDEREMLHKSLLELSSQSFIDLRQGNLKSSLKNLVTKIWFNILFRIDLLLKAQAIFLEQIDKLEIDAKIIKNETPLPEDSSHLNGLILSCLIHIPLKKYWVDEQVVKFYSEERRGSPIRIHSALLMFISDVISEFRK